MRPLNRVASVFVGFNPALIRKGTGTRTICLTVRSLEDGRIDETELTEEKVPSTGAVPMVYADDLVLPSRSTRVVTAIVPPHLDGLPINSTVLGIRCSPQLHPLILKAYFNHPVGVAALNSTAVSSTGQMSISVKRLGDIEVPVPPREQQDRLVDLLQQTEDAFEWAMCAARQRYRTSNELVMQQILREN